MTHRKHKGDDADVAAKESMRMLIDATSKASKVTDKLKATLTKPTTKSTKSDIEDILFYIIRLQLSLYAIVLGDAQSDIDNAAIE